MIKLTKKQKIRIAKVKEDAQRRMIIGVVTIAVSIKDYNSLKDYEQASVDSLDLAIRDWLEERNIIEKEFKEGKDFPVKAQVRFDISVAGDSSYPFKEDVGWLRWMPGVGKIDERGKIVEPIKIYEKAK